MKVISDFLLQSTYFPILPHCHFRVIVVGLLQLILFLDKMVEYHFILRFVRRSPMATRNVLTTFFSGDAADRFAAVS